MKKTPLPSSEPDILAVLHRCGRVWRGLIASNKTARPSILANREFTAADIGRLDSWLDEHQAASVLCVLPAADVICRTYPLPNAAPEQLEQALRLQAEAHLLGMAPPHRLGMAVLPAAAGETSRTGLVLAWPEKATFSPPETNRPITFVADIAAIAALLNGQRPADPVLWLDRQDGSIALALTHASGVLFRATREDAESPDAWQTVVGRLVAESALNVNHSPGFVESLVAGARALAGNLRPAHAVLSLPAELIPPVAARVQGASDEAAWWSQYGVAVGSLLARTGPLASLTTMLVTPPIEKPSPVKRVAERLSQPKTAVRLVVACVAVLLFAPLLVSAARLGALKLRHGNLSQQQTEAKSAKTQLAVYREMEKQTIWPMTKLLGDITTRTPLGIELESLRIESGKDFAVGGTVIAYGGKSPTEVVAQFERNLRKNNLFEDVNVQWGSANNLGMFKFDLTAKVAKPYELVKYDTDDDFGKWTHQARRDGKKPDDSNPTQTSGSQGGTAVVDAGGANSTAEPPIIALDNPDDDSNQQPVVGDESEPGNDSEGSGRDRARPTMRTVTPDSKQGDPTENNSDGVAGHREIPPPITQEQIEKWSREELQAHLTKVASARKYSTDDKEKERLRAEFSMIMAQIRKLREKPS